MRTTRHPHQIGIVLAGGGMLLVSLDSLGIRLAEETAWNVAFWLGSFIAVAMFIFVPMRNGRSLPSLATADGWPMLASALLQTASTGLFILALTLTTVANTVVIVAAAPVMAALIAHYAIGEKTPLRTWLAIAGALAGILVVVSGSLGAGRVQGDLFAVGAILAFSINLTIWRRLPRLNRQVVIGLAGLLLAVVAFVPANPFDVDTRAIVILAILGIVTGPAGRVFIASSTRYLPVSQVSLFTPVETIAATGWAWLFLAEIPSVSTVVGGVIVIAAVILGIARQPEEQAVPAPPH